MKHKTARSQFDRNRALPMETLETRVLLAAVPANYRLPGPPGGFEPTTEDIADVKHGPMSNAGQQLIDIYREYRKFQRAGGNNADFESTWNEYVLFKGASVGVVARGTGNLTQLTERLRESGAELIYRHGRFNAIEAYVPVGQLHELARDPGLLSLTPMFLGKTKQVGIAHNDAGIQMKTDAARANFGLDGSGVTVGVVSDSANKFGDRLAGSVATGDLPLNGVNLLYDDSFAASDEGRGMLELIHDIAPGAALQFAGSGVSQSVMADSIRALRLAGSDIIVDDIEFFAEPIFQPGVIDEAVTDIVDDGGIFLSAAGNGGNNAYENPASFTRIGRTRYIDFNPGAGVDTNLRITGGGQVRLWWDNPYNGIVGGATTDLDIYFYDTTYHRIVSFGTANNLKTGVPQELFNLPFGTWDMEIRVADHATGAVLPTRFRVQMDSFEPGEFAPEARPTIVGHAGHSDSISVGAVPFWNPTENEDFSSHGPMTRLFDADGDRIPRVDLLKPDISGIDDTNTSFFGSDSGFDEDVLPNFNGTSAAAPNVAAFVALAKEASPQLTQAEILTAMQNTAIPLNGNGPGWDEQGGYGLVDGLAAIQTFLTPPDVHIVSVRPDPRSGPVDSVKIVFSQRVVGFGLEDVTLTRDGGPNLLTGAQTLQTTDNNRTFMLRELRDLTAPAGEYTLTLIASGSNITNVTSLLQPLSGGDVETWTNVGTPEVPLPPSDLKFKVIDEGVVRLRWTDNSSTEDRFIIERAEDRDFTVKTKTFEVPANTTVFTDQVILPVGKHVYYRVRAVSDFSGFQQSSNVVQVFLPGPGEIVLDNESSRGILVNGNWGEVAGGADTNGESYLSDLNSGKGDKNVRFTPNIAQAGDYFVYARWTSDSNRATNVPIDIVYGSGNKQTVTVDQRNTGGEGWVLLGKFRFELGTGGFVRIRNDGTNGVVVADAVRFQPANGAR